MSIYIDPISAVFVLFPICVAVALLGRGSWRRRFTIVQDLGIPIGVIGALIGMLQMITDVDNVDVVLVATGVMLLTIFYGGILSAAGYFLVETKWAASDHHGCVPVSFWRPAIVVTSFILSLLFAIFFGVQFEIFLNKVAALICGLASVLALLVSSPSGRTTNLSRAVLWASMIAVVAGLIMLFRGDQDNGLLIAANGLIYGLVGYVTLYIWCVGRPEGETINASLTNWHWMEVTGFFIFMFLAPDTILDNFQEQAVQQQIQELQSEIAILRGGES
jgi:hypothetical protein